MAHEPQTDPAKLAAAREAVALVRDGMKLGLGTGSTAKIATAVRRVTRARSPRTTRSNVTRPTPDRRSISPRLIPAAASTVRCAAAGAASTKV